MYSTNDGKWKRDWPGAIPQQISHDADVDNVYKFGAAAFKIEASLSQTESQNAGKLFTTMLKDCLEDRQKMFGMDQNMIWDVSGEWSENAWKMVHKWSGKCPQKGQKLFRKWSKSGQESVRRMV